MILYCPGVFPTHDDFAGMVNHAPFVMWGIGVAKPYVDNYVYLESEVVPSDALIQFSIRWEEVLLDGALGIEE